MRTYGSDAWTDAAWKEVQVIVGIVILLAVLLAVIPTIIGPILCILFSIWVVWWGLKPLFGL